MAADALGDRCGGAAQRMRGVAIAPVLWFLVMMVRSAVLVQRLLMRLETGAGELFGEQGSVCGSFAMVQSAVTVQ
ncbi:hypothetical protein DUNSADRAFT_4782 [Dunaliella salina]|uniref:Encoded protein n=1 Tax=Dunaliella salina TaxID=3046 RepID=A0ABQ7GRC0_DUNSA|nr:hypothetical protein DUNSADRAFT_4782 [Dunaliella salina]|eukprot:KAF5837161.1 hypothetical protein DUNSADRAFT_4782 [Dunaliella salina]